MNRAWGINDWDWVEKAGVSKGAHTTPFRVRIKEIATESAWSGAEMRRIESAILRAIEELLTREPSDGMKLAGWRAIEGVGEREHRIWKIMSAQLLKEAKGE